MAQHFKDLIAWQKSMALVRDVYAVTEAFPKDEVFGLRSQIRRCAVSIPSNIAEGQARFSPAEFQRFLRTAKGSAAELETQVILAQQLGYIHESQTRTLEAAIAEVGRLISGLLNSLANRKSAGL